MKLVRENKAAFLILGLFLIVGVILVNRFSHLDLQIKTNQFTNTIGDYIFLFFTRLAEPWFTVPLLVYLLVKNWKKAIYIGSAYGISAVITQAIKLKLYHGTPRPFGTQTLRENTLYHWSSLELPKINSFPSGHTTTGFCIFMGLVLLSKNKKLGIPFMVIACLIGLSRTYLSYHFMIDIIVGAFIGASTSILLYLVLKKPLKLAD